MKSFTDPLTGQLVEMQDVEFSTFHDKTLLEWEQAKQALDAAKDKELRLRNLYVALASDPTKKKGTENVPLGNGYKAKIVKSVRFGWVKGPDDKTDTDAIHAAQDEIEKLGNEGPFLADRLVKWTAELSVSEFNKLEPEGNPTHAKVKAILEKVIVTKDGTPTLEIVAPKS